LAAVGDATARTLLPESGYTRPEWDRDRFAAYEMATALHDRYVVAVPPQPSLVPAGYAEETCSHGRRFDAECSDCGA
jgi:hypothetical protein